MKEFKDVKLLVVGAGTMGSVIGQVFAAAGIKTTLADIKEEFLEGAIARIQGNIDGMIKNGMCDESYREICIGNISTVLNSEIPAIGKEFDMVVEVVPEKHEIKAATYKMLNEACRPDCIFCSNTSGMPVFDVCKEAVPDQSRMLVTHWFNPPHMMKLVEVVYGPDTTEEVGQYVKGILEFIGKKPAVLKKFMPGFIVNRMATVICREFYYMVENGWITAEDAENAMRYTNGIRWGFEGPLALWDFVGLQIPVDVAKDVLPTVCNSTEFPALANKLIAEGKTGTKAGEGMLKWGPVEEYVAKRNKRILQMTLIAEQWDKEDSE